MAHRGQLTPAISQLFEGFFGTPGTTLELRLIPYLFDCVINNKRLNPNLISSEERKIWIGWHNDKRDIVGGGSANPLWASQEFFDFMGKVLWLGYADYRNQQPEVENT